MSRLTRELESFLAGIGFELVTLDRSGGRRGSRLRLKIDRPWGEAGESPVTIEDCTRVARRLRELLDAHEDVPGEYSLEVSSPGVERPLVRARDYRRFAGREVRLKGYGPLDGERKHLEGVLLGLEEGAVVAVEVAGERVEVPLSAIASARLTYDWDDAF